MKNQYSVLAFYKYVEIDSPENFRDSHHELCVKNKLLGRIYIAKEGINGTVSGLKKNCDNYIKELKNDSRFFDMDIKMHNASEHAFQKINVRVKNEIVNSGLKNLDPSKEFHSRIKPKDFWKNIDDNTIVLDMRSNYEHKLGKFKGAMTLDIDNFREFPKKLEEVKDKLVGKKVIAYCTGDVKCEKASVYLKNLGVKDVHHLEGGIIRYGLETDGRDFEGKCYVFDNRVTVEINKHNPSVISKCYICDFFTDKMVNCANSECNLHTTICEKCLKEKDGACSKECKMSITKRDFNEKGYFYRKLNGYRYSQMDN